MRNLAILAALSGSISAVLAGTAGTPWTINVAAVPLQQRATWCQGETNTCTLLCPIAPKTNNCTTETLDFTCTCQNGSAPGLQYYTQTMPTFICQQAFTDCINQNVGDAAGQANCTTNIKSNCGTLDAASAVSSTSSSATPTATGADVSSSGSATTAPTTSTSKAAAPTNVYYYGNGAAVVAMGLFAYLV